MKGRFLHVGRSLIALGMICIFLGIISFFPVFSYKPWFAGWSAHIACPIWNGALAFIVGVLVVLAERDYSSRSLPGAGLTFALMTLVTSAVQCGVALAALLIGPFCYFSYGGVTGLGYLGYTIRFPYRYSLTPVCLDPPLHEFYHLGLHTLSSLLGLAIFSLVLALCLRLAIRFHATGTLSVRIPPPECRLPPAGRRISVLQIGSVIPKSPGSPGELAFPCLKPPSDC
ncbi:transmembrane protein 212-like [Pristis pectinata]|uniref:transmembrane protein 212-like n=1 Tax=Pristis pectinata TaxID=685728 RepID=UPI00223E280F|nr:transmembrane protein 212-like [Pristis pectinata]